MIVLKNKEKQARKVEIGEAFGFDFKGKYYGKVKSESKALKI